MKNANSSFVYMIKFENCILTFKHSPKNPPLPWWEGMKGRGTQPVLSTPTLTLPHQRGRGIVGKKF